MPSPDLVRLTTPVPLLAMTELIVLVPEPTTNCSSPAVLSAPPAVKVPPVKLRPEPAMTVPTAPNRSVLPVPIVTVLALAAALTKLLMVVTPVPTVTVPVVLPVSEMRTLFAAALAMTPPCLAMSV